MLPFSDDLQNVDEYYSFKGADENICNQEADRWLANFVFKHDYLPKQSNGFINTDVLKEALKRSPIAVAVYAWAHDGEKYIRLGNDTHWTVLFGFEDGKFWRCYDSYAPHVKNLAWDFGFSYAKRIYIRLKTDEEKKTEQEQLSLIERIIRYITQLIPFFTKQVEEKVRQELPPIPAEPEPKEKTTLGWDTPLKARHSARVIMDQYGLKWSEKDLLCAVIQAESGFKTQVKNQNKNKDGVVLSTDYGICQINDFYWIGQGKYFSSAEEVLNYPEKSVKFMCARFKEGKLNLWSAYNNKAYLHNLWQQELNFHWHKAL